MPRFISRLTYVLAVLAIVPVQASVGAQSGQSATDPVGWTGSDLYSFDFDHGDVSGWATVRRTRLGVAVVVHATGLTPGNVYVLRAADDRDVEIGADGTYLTGNVAGRYGTTTFMAHFEPTTPVEGSAGWVPRLMLGDAGAATPGEVSRQLLGLTGACIPGASGCFQLLDLTGSQ